MHDVTSCHFLFDSPKIISGMQYGVYISLSWNVIPELNTAPNQHTDVQVGTFHVDHRFDSKDVGTNCDQHGKFQHMDTEVETFHANHEFHPYNIGEIREKMEN